MEGHIMTTAGTLKVEVSYGLGVTFAAELPRAEVEGATVTRIVRQAALAYKGNGCAGRAAELTLDALGSGRLLDFEISRNHRPDANAAGATIGPEDVPYPAGVDDANRPEGMHFAVSESYVGG